MHQLTAGGATVVHVSHNSVTMEKMCSEVLWLDRGQKKMMGDARQVIGAYEASSAEESAKDKVKEDESQKWKSFFSDLIIERQGGKVFIKGQPTDAGHLVFVIEKPTGSGEPNRAALGSSYFFGEEPLKAGDEFDFTVEIDGFTPGSYRCLIGLMKNPTGQVGEKYLLPPTVAGSFTLDAEELLDRYRTIPATQVVNLLPARNPEFSYRVNGNLVGKFEVRPQDLD